MLNTFLFILMLFIYAKIKRGNVMTKLKILSVSVLVLGLFIINSCKKDNFNTVHYSTGINITTGVTTAELDFSIKRPNKNIDQFEKELGLKLGDAKKYYLYGDNFTDLKHLRTYEQVKKGLDQGYTLPLVYIIKSNSEIYYILRSKGGMGGEPIIDIYTYDIKLQYQNSFDDPKGILKSRKRLIQSLVNKYFN